MVSHLYNKPLSFHVELVGLKQPDRLCLQRNLQFLELGRFYHHLRRVFIYFLERLLEPEPIPVVRVAHRNKVLGSHVVV